MSNSLNPGDLVKGLLIGGLVGGVASWLSTHSSEEKTCATDDCSHYGIVLGGSILGAVLGVAAGLLLAPSSGEDLRKDLGGRYDDVRKKAEKFLADINEKGHSAAGNLDDWKDSLVSIVDSLSGPQARRQASDKMNELADWASLGLSVLKKFQNRK